MYRTLARLLLLTAVSVAVSGGQCNSPGKSSVGINNPGGTTPGGNNNPGGNNPGGGTPTLTISPASLPSATEDAFYRVRFSASGGSGSYTWSLTSVAPSAVNLAFYDNDEWLWGWPTPVGTRTITVTATDTQVKVGSNALTATRTYSMDVLAGGGPVVFATAALPAAEVGVPYEYTLRALGGYPPYQWSETFPVVLAQYGLELATSYTSSGLGNTYNQGVGIIRGTPTQSGTLQPGILVKDLPQPGQGSQQQDTGNVTLTIQAAGTGAAGPSFGALGAQDGPRSSNVEDVQVTVYDKVGTPVEGAEVFLTQSAGPTTAQTTDAQGHATFQGLDVGPFTATAWYNAGNEEYDLVSLVGVDAPWVHLRLERYVSGSVARVTGAVQLPAGKNAWVSVPGPDGGVEVDATNPNFDLRVEAGRSHQMVCAVLDPATKVRQGGKVVQVSSVTAGGVVPVQPAVDLGSGLTSVTATPGQIGFAAPFTDDALTGLLVVAVDAQGRDVGHAVDVPDTLPQGASPRTVNAEVQQFSSPDAYYYLGWATEPSAQPFDPPTHGAYVEGWLASNWGSSSPALPAVDLPGQGYFPSIDVPTANSTGFVAARTVAWTAPVGLPLGTASAFHLLKITQDVPGTQAVSLRTWRLYLPSDLGQVVLPDMPASLAGMALDDTANGGNVVLQFASTQVATSTPWEQGKDVDLSAIQALRQTERSATVYRSVGK